MNTDESKDRLIDEALKSIYSDIQPNDSWEELRVRIDKKISNSNTSSPGIRSGRNYMFWRRAALAMVACFVITSAILIYVLLNIQNIRNQNDEAVLSQAQLYQLSTAFSQVRRLFDEQLPWMVVDSAGQGEIGITEQASGIADTEKIIILRLAVNTEAPKKQDRYFDVVAFSNQQVNFHITMENISEMNINLRPTITKGGKIAVEINTQVDGDSQTGDVVTVSNNLFSSPVRVSSNSNRINICVAGQSVSVI